MLPHVKHLFLFRNPCILVFFFIFCKLVTFKRTLFRLFFAFRQSDICMGFTLCFLEFFNVRVLKKIVLYILRVLKINNRLHTICTLIKYCYYWKCHFHSMQFLFIFFTYIPNTNL